MKRTWWVEPGNRSVRQVVRWMACGLILGVCTAAQAQPQESPNESPETQNNSQESDPYQTYQNNPESSPQRRSYSAAERRDGQSSQRPSQQNQTAQGSQNFQARQERAGLGVLMVDSDRGVQIRDVTPGSPAEEAGIRRGDEIFEINGRRVFSTAEFSRAIQQEQPGDQVELRVRREGQVLTVNANLESRREALNLNESSWAQSNMMDEEGILPGGVDDVLRHVEALERQVRRMQSEIQDLRSMLNNDPRVRQMSQQGNWNNQSQVARRQNYSDDSSHENRRFDGQEDQSYSEQPSYSQGRSEDSSGRSNQD